MPELPVGPSWASSPLPIIDPATSTLYAVAETYESGKVVHRLHALDVTTGSGKVRRPHDHCGNLYAKRSYHHVYRSLPDESSSIAHGQWPHLYCVLAPTETTTTPCQGWVLSYNSGTLQQEGAYTVEPGKVLASIWQKGAGLSADTAGNIYGESGEGPFVDGTNLSSSVQKLSQIGTTLALADWFTPYNQDISFRQ